MIRADLFLWEIGVFAHAEGSFDTGAIVMTQLEFAAELTFLPALQRELDQTFDLPFAFWTGDECGWSRCDEDTGRISPDALASLHPHLQDLAQIHDLAASVDPTLVALDSDSQWLLMPLHDEEINLLATAIVPNMDAATTLRMAQLFTPSFQRGRTIARLQAENQRLRVRSYDCLEELSFLRQTVEHLASRHHAARTPTRSPDAR